MKQKLFLLLVSVVLITTLFSSLFFYPVNAAQNDTDVSNPNAVVVPPIQSGVSLNYDTYFCMLGTAFKLVASYLSTGDVTLSWSSSNPSVASVDSSGNVTSHMSGTAVITVCAQFSSDSTSLAPSQNYYDSCTVRVGIPDGSYYLKNKQTERYAHAANLMAGAIISQSTFDGTNNQKWTFTSLGDGYYSISLPSGHYLGVSNNSSDLDVAIELFTTCNSDGTQWRISETESGAYKITAKTGEANDYVLATSSSETNKDVYLLQGDYILNNSYRDEWWFIEPEYTYTVSHYYDEGYDVRFSNASENISAYQTICSALLFERFGIETSYSISPYTSCSDTCTGTPVSLSLTTQSCIHDYSHKTHYALFSESLTMNPERSNQHSSIIWTGHKLTSGASCTYVDYHVIVMTIGMVTDSTSNNLDSNTIRYERIYTLLHEISHDLGAPDHYCYDLFSEDCGNPTNDCWRCDNGLSSEPVCLMSNRMDDLEARLENNDLTGIYCSQCLSSIHEKGIFTHLNDHHTIEP